MSKPIKRKSLFVDPKVQSALAVRLAVHWLLFAAITAVITISLKWFSDPFQPFSSLLSAFFNDQWPMLLTMALLLPTFIYDSLKLSNRFAGPVIRFRRHVNEIADGGELKHLQFRKGDFWHELAGDFNRMLARFRENEEAAAAVSDVSSRFVSDDLEATPVE